MKAFSKILVPIDFTPQSAAAVQRSVELAAHSNAEIVLVHFHDPAEYPLPSDSIAYTRAQLERMSQPLVQRLEATRRDIEGQGVRLVASRLEYGEPALGILRIAQEEGFDLIVMGTHGRTGMSRWVMGSVAEKVVRSARCAVLTVKAPSDTTASVGSGPFASAQPVLR